MQNVFDVDSCVLELSFLHLFNAETWEEDIYISVDEKKSKERTESKIYSVRYNRKIIYHEHLSLTERNESRPLDELMMNDNENNKIWIWKLNVRNKTNDDSPSDDPLANIYQNYIFYAWEINHIYL
jgi:hypothetical protein